MAGLSYTLLNAQGILNIDRQIRKEIWSAAYNCITFEVLEIGLVTWSWYSWSVWIRTYDKKWKTSANQLLIGFGCFGRCFSASIFELGWLFWPTSWWNGKVLGARATVWTMRIQLSLMIFAVQLMRHVIIVSLGTPVRWTKWVETAGLLTVWLASAASTVWQRGPDGFLGLLDTHTFHLGLCMNGRPVWWQSHPSMLDLPDCPFIDWNGVKSGGCQRG